MRTSVRFAPALLLLAGLFTIKPAFADFLYDFTASGGTEIQFSEPTLLTSVTTVNSFILAVSGIGTIESVTLDPVVAGTCPTSGSPISGPCYSVLFDSGVGWDTYATPFTSTGTYIGTLVGSTLTISSETPEPNSFFLLLTPFLAFMAHRFRKRFQQSA